MNNTHVQEAPKRRRHQRLVCQSDATVQVGSWPRKNKIRGRVRNASSAGACIELERGHTLQPGETATINCNAIAQLKGFTMSRNCNLTGTVVRMGSLTSAAATYGIKFDSLIQEQLNDARVRSKKFMVATFAASVAGLIALLKAHNVMFFWYEPILQLYSIGAASFILSRVILSLFYREPKDVGYMPTLTIVIAAKNEGARIGETIEHCYKSNYPTDLYEVIAIDDGSDDNTWEVMNSLQSRFPTLRLIRFEKNLGKRHGMAIGAEKATGEILVYVDSDSFPDPEAIYRIVQPFANPRIGAVSGHVLVAVEQDNFISKMESVRYFVSHMVMKTAESIFGCVTCCPGAFSAYRRSAVMNVLPAWLGQTFLGTAATFGDDRSLTNFILRTHQVIFHAGATALTYTPRTWRQFFKQQLRWKKSWARETTVAVRLMWKKHPVAALFYYIGIMITMLSPIVAIRALIFLPMVMSLSWVPYLTGVMLVYLFLCLIFLYHNTDSPHWYYGLAFAVLYICILSLQNYYAMATVRKNHWGTR